MFSCEFCKILRTPFLMEQLWRLLQKGLEYVHLRDEMKSNRYEISSSVHITFHFGFISKQHNVQNDPIY